MLRAGKPVPPILVYRSDGGYAVWDDHARLQSYRNLGIKRIPANEIVGSWQNVPEAERRGK
jgi:hypothetical protein